MDHSSVILAICGLFYVFVCVHACFIGCMHVYVVHSHVCAFMCSDP